jgi:hypothetical protein
MGGGGSEVPVVLDRVVSFALLQLNSRGKRFRCSLDTTQDGTTVGLNILEARKLPGTWWESNLIAIRLYSICLPT